MAKRKSSKERANKRNNKKHQIKNPNPKFQPKQKKAKLINNGRNDDAEDPILFGPSTSSYEPSHAPGPATVPVPAPESESDSETPSSPTRIHSLLEPYSKDQLISFLLDAAVPDPSLRARIRSAADSDISHRKIFVHGLGWDATSADLLEVVSPFGPIEECNVVTDRVTGRAKGYGFVVYKTRSAAIKALKETQKRVKNRFASFQLASVGPIANPPPWTSVGATTVPTPVPPSEERRVYVSNVHAETPPDKLRSLFAKFGEIEAGPMGYDKITGKSRGYAIFVYKNQEGARRALEEPYKMFEGHQLHCQLYTPSNKAKAAGMMPSAMPTPPPPQQQQQQMMAPQSVLAAMAAAQNLALLGQNPAYSMLLAQNPLLAAAAMNPAAMNQAAMMQAYGAGGGGGQSVLGTYGQGTYGQGSAAEMQGFPGASTQPGQMSSGNSGSMFGGFPSSFVW